MHGRCLAHQHSYRRTALDEGQIVLVAGFGLLSLATDAEVLPAAGLGPAPGIVVRVRWRIVGDGTWQEGNGTYNKDFWFVDDQGLRGYNEEHRFTIPAATTARAT